MDPQAPGSLPLEARCAVHLGQPFTAVCQRCGTYMCQACTEGGRFAVCPACRARTGVGDFPFRRGAWSFNQLLAFSWQVYKRNVAVLTLAVAAALAVVFGFQGISFVLSALFPDQILLVALFQMLLVVPQFLLQNLVTLGMLSIAVRVARGEPVRLGLLVSEWRLMGPFLMQGLLMVMLFFPGLLLAFLVGLGIVLLGNQAPAMAITLGAISTLVAVVAFAYVMLGLSFASFEIVAQPGTAALDGMKNAWAIARGQRAAILACALLVLLAITAGASACLIGLPFALGFASVLFATFYLTLRNGAGGLVGARHG